MRLDSDYHMPGGVDFKPRPGIPKSRLYPYYSGRTLELTNIFNYGNACGQSAMAILLTYWNKIAVSNPLSKNVEGLYKASWSKPDMIGGLFGTSIERVGEVLQRYGLNAQGHNEPRNTVTVHKGKKNWLIDHVKRGYPVACILDMGFLYGGMVAHWVVVVGHKPGKFAVGNFVPKHHVNDRRSPVADDEGVAWLSEKDFMKGWQGNLPFIHFGAVTCHP